MSARPTWAEVNLTALQQNYRAVQQLVSTDSTICCVVKCDAYGHGSVECARALQEIGATWFGVTSTEEAVKLRRGGITARILVMTGFGTVETAVQALRQGVDGLLLKPFEVGGELVATVQQALDDSLKKRDSARIQALRPLFDITESFLSETRPDRLLDLVGEHWEVLLWMLILFHYVYPAHADYVPRRLWDDLLGRLRHELEAARALLVKNDKS